MNQDLDHVTASSVARLPATTRLRTELTTREFEFIADSPSRTGAGLGPTPTEYLLMALASCTAQTIRLYADRKYDYAGDIVVEVKQHEPREEGAERFLERTVSMSEPLPPEDYETIREIVERTPVTLLLAYAWSVRTAFVDHQ
jgi:uncharacterized OsmC-like protein